MTDSKVSEAQRRATKKWEEQNPEQKRYLRYRSNARTFVITTYLSINLFVINCGLVIAEPITTQ